MTTARFSDVDVFLAVADAGTFRRAAERLGVTKSTVSRAIQRLEEHLGAALLIRDRHTQRLTDAGKSYLRHAAEAARALTDAEHAVAALSEDVGGTLRVSAPAALGQVVLARLCAEFIQAHPLVSVDLVLSDRLVSLSAEPFDLTIRASPRLEDSDLKARHLGRARIIAIASPPVAAALAAGEEVPLVELSRSGRPRGPLAPAGVRPLSRLRVNDYLTLKEVLLTGHGVGVMSELLVRPELESGRLVQVLPDWSLPTANYWALFPATTQMPPRTRAFVDHLVAGFRPAALR